MAILVGVTWGRHKTVTTRRGASTPPTPRLLQPGLGYPDPARPELDTETILVSINVFDDR
jgi:hypothetical protein